MTRINIVPVETLTDKHLLAEYKKITRPFNKVFKRIENGTLNQVEIPKSYCLGKGHETFFFDKLLWLYKRYYQLRNELLNRNFNIDADKFDEIAKTIAMQLRSTECWRCYTPTPEDMYLNMARLCKRSNLDNVLEELQNVN